MSELASSGVLAAVEADMARGSLLLHFSLVAKRGPQIFHLACTVWAHECLKIIKLVADI